MLLCITAAYLCEHIVKKSQTALGDFPPLLDLKHTRLKIFLLESLQHLKIHTCSISIKKIIKITADDAGFCWPQMAAGRSGSEFWSEQHTALTYSKCFLSLVRQGGEQIEDQQLSLDNTFGGYFLSEQKRRFAIAANQQ